MRHGRLLLATVMVIVLAPVLRAEQPAKPGPEYDVLKELEGTWDATIKFGGMEGKGTMTYKMGLGGHWLLSKYEGDFAGQKFEGRGMDGYDPMKKKYIGIWADSMSPVAMISEGTYDKDSKTMTMTGEGAGQDGKMTKYKSTMQMKDKDTVVFTMSAVNDGKEQEMMTITYKRK